MMLPTFFLRSMESLPTNVWPLFLQAQMFEVHRIQNGLTCSSNRRHLLKLSRFALRSFHSHSGATGVFWLICRTVYFRCAANLIAASSKIGVRRLKVGDLLIKILVHCALLCLAFLVLGRS